jgi:prepilin-type N-terminal cleavage/methylation domain-containing protein
MTTHKQSGFTLVELAIVMTIIGLLIGGILKGQELMLNARVTATIAQVRSYEAAATTFRDSFASLPGDMPGASTRLPGCVASCDPVAASAGNSIIGNPLWSAGWASQGVALSDTTVSKETTLFWIHLLAADLISGVSPEPITTPATAVQWGVTHPQARINGGFVIGYANGAGVQPGLAATVNTNPTGLQLALNTAPNIALGTTAGQNPLTAGKAAQIDRKMDDGRPSSGFVQAYGVTASCFTAAGTLVYAEGTTGNDCGVLFRIQG